MTSLYRREQLVAARESEFSAHRPLRRLWWALQYSPLTAIEVAAVLAVMAGVVLFASPVFTLLGAILMALACLGRLCGLGRPR